MGPAPASRGGGGRELPGRRLGRASVDAADGRTLIARDRDRVGLPDRLARFRLLSGGRVGGAAELEPARPPAPDRSDDRPDTDRGRNGWGDRGGRSGTAPGAGR